MKDKHLKPYEPDQSLLLPPNMNDWIPESHLAFFVRDVVAELDLSGVYDAYAPGAKGGNPPCDPRMMTGLVKLGHVSLDGTKVRANASKHKAMSYGRMRKKRAGIAEREKKRREEEERTGRGTPGRKPKAPSDEPAEKAQRPQVRTHDGADFRATSPTPTRGS